MTERITEVQQQHADALEDLKARMTAIEHAEISLRKISVGPRGGIGPAGHHAEAIKGDQGDRGHTGSIGPQGQNGQNGLNAEFSREAVEGIILEILKDYGIVSEIGPMKKFVPLVPKSGN